MNRVGMQCATCSYGFVMNPKLPPRLSDRRALAMARRLSRDGEVGFTARQLFAAAAARRRFLRWTLSARVSDMDRTLDGLDRLSRLHPRAFERMITEPGLSAAGTHAWPEPDVYDYGAERIVVVDQTLAVDLLIDAGVHMTARAIVIDVGGYPPRITELARALVETRPNVPVAMLHGSDADPTLMAGRVRALLGSALPVTDVGLSRFAAKELKSLRWARRLPSVPLDALPRAMLTSALTDALLTGKGLEAAAAGDDGRFSDRSDGDYG